MSKLLKILKINFLSIIATPLLFLSAVVKLVLIALLSWLCSFMPCKIKPTLYSLISVLDRAHQFTYSGFLLLFGNCENDFSALFQEDKPLRNGLLCLFFTILKVLDKIITGIVSVSYPLAICLTALTIIAPIWKLWRKTSAAFGIGLFRYLSKCGTGSVIIGILYYLLVTCIIVTLLFALAAQWNEWAQQLSMTSLQINTAINTMTNTTLQLANDSSEEVTNDLLLIQKLEDHVKSLDNMEERIQNILDQKDDLLLRSHWVSYIRALSPLVAKCSTKKGILSKHLQQISPQIGQLDRQRDAVLRILGKYEHAAEAYANRHST